MVAELAKSRYGGRAFEIEISPGPRAHSSFEIELSPRPCANASFEIELSPRPRANLSFEIELSPRPRASSSFEIFHAMVAEHAKSRYGGRASQVTLW